MALDYFLLQQKTCAAEKQIKKYKCLTLIKVKLISGREKFHKPRFPKNFWIFLWLTAHSEILDRDFAATGNFDQDKFKYRRHSDTRLCYFLKFPPLMLISATSSVFHSCFASHSSFAGTLANRHPLTQRSSAGMCPVCRDVFCLQGCVLSACQLRTPYHQSLSKIPLCLATVALAAPLSAW